MQLHVSMFSPDAWSAAVLAQEDTWAYVFVLLSLACVTHFSSLFNVGEAWDVEYLVAAPGGSSRSRSKNPISALEIQLTTFSVEFSSVY